MASSTFIDTELSDDTDVDSDEELVKYGGLRDCDLLSENSLQPIWTSDGYPGQVPDEIAEYIGSEGTSECHLSVIISWAMNFNP